MITLEPLTATDHAATDQSMENNNRLADQFCNIALMYAFLDTDHKILTAFNDDDHATVGKYADLYEALTANVLEYIPTVAA